MQHVLVLFIFPVWPGTFRLRALLHQKPRWSWGLQNLHQTSNGFFLGQGKLPGTAHLCPWKDKNSLCPTKIMEGSCIFPPTETDIQRPAMPTRRNTQNNSPSLQQMEQSVKSDTPSKSSKVLCKLPSTACLLGLSYPHSAHQLHPQTQRHSTFTYSGSWNEDPAQRYPRWLWTPHPAPQQRLEVGR